MTVGSLFSGIGGLDLGFERAGFTITWQVESDPFCQRVLAAHWPDVPCYPDIRTCDAELAPVDVVMGGFPCQPVSLAGQRQGQDDARWLWPDMARIIRLLRPRYVVVENVPGLLVRGFSDVLGDLADSGYDAEWDCLSAASVGAPHIRNRVFVLAYAHREGELQPEGRQCEEWRRVGDSGWWAVEPDVVRVAHGVPHRLAQLRSLGNAVVPQVAEVIARRVMERAR